MLDKGAKIKVHDPEAMKEAKPLLPDNISYCSSIEEVFENADAIVLMTEWNQYRGLDLKKVKSMMKGNVFVDLRKVYESELMDEIGFDYYCVGR